MPAVSNTSPLSNLAIIGRLDLAREQLGRIIIPPAVREELDLLPNRVGKTAIELAIQNEWIKVVALSGPIPSDLSLFLDRGEAEALALALNTKAGLILLDESAARQKAQQLGVACVGVLGILRQARVSGRIPLLKPEIARLRVEARFFIAQALEKRILASVGET